MGMTIDKAIKQLTTYSIPCGKYKDAYDMAIETMRKYQKIEDIYYHQSGEALENSLRAVIENGNVD